MMIFKILKFDLILSNEKKWIKYIITHTFKYVWYKRFKSYILIFYTIHNLDVVFIVINFFTFIF